MRLIDRCRYLWRAIFQRARVERDVDDELRDWVDSLTERHRAAGVSAAEARRLAIAQIGGIESMRQIVRDGRVGSALAGVSQDARFGWRALRRAPGFALMVALTLGLGIGATTAIFSVVHALLLAPLPYRDPSRLVFVWSDMTVAGYPRAPLSGPELVDLRDRATTLAAVGGIWATTSALTGDGDPEQLRIGLVTTNFFSVLGADPALGRVFGPEDEQQPSSASILLSWGVFARRFGADPSVVGRRIQVNGQPVTVVGIMPKGFRLWLPLDSSVPDDLQAWVPMRSAGLARQPRGQQYLRVVGRMKPGVPLPAARADITLVAAAISREFMEYGSAGRLLTTVALQADDVREVKPTLVAVFGGVLILAVIACVNVANLLVARAAARRRETALRMTLGAGLGRLARECLMEGLMLAAAGAAVGVLVGWIGLNVLVAWRPAGLDRIAAAHISLSVLAFTCVVTLICGLLFSLAPLVEARQARPIEALQRDGQRVSGGVHRRTRSVLVTVQIALGVILLIGAGLLGRTFVQVQRVDLGFQSDHALTFRVVVPFARYRSRDAIIDFSRRLQASLAALPGVTGVGAISHLPYDELPNWGGPYLIHAGEDEATAPNADYRAVTPGFFEETGARLLEGRLFTEADDPQSSMAVIVDGLLARRAWPGQSAVGQRIQLDPGSSGHPSSSATVIGVIHHLRVRSLVADLTEQVYFSVRQVLRSPMAYVVRTSGDPAAIGPAVRQAIAALDSQLPVYDVRPFDSYLRDAAASKRFSAMLATIFAGVALVLACVGIYGVVAYGVTQRRPEFGVRFALGARRAQVIRLVLREGAALAAVGLGLGLAGAIPAAHWLESQLYGVTPIDPLTYGVALAMLAGAAVVACWLPARRAAQSSPLDALRAE